MKVSVDQDKCIGCGACVAISPENFDFNDEGLSIVKNDNITEKTIDAAEACPTYAISVEQSNKDDECTCEHCECHCSDDCSCGDECDCSEECNCGCITDDCECNDCCCGECDCESNEGE